MMFAVQEHIHIHTYTKIICIVFQLKLSKNFKGNLLKIVTLEYIPPIEEGQIRQLKYLFEGKTSFDFV